MYEKGIGTRFERVPVINRITRYTVKVAGNCRPLFDGRPIEDKAAEAVAQPLAASGLAADADVPAGA